MLVGVGERLGGDVIAGHFDELRKAAGKVDGQIDGKAWSLGQRLQGTAESGIAHDRRAETAGEAAQLLDCIVEFAHRLGEQRGHGRIALRLPARQTKGQRQSHKPLLGAVVQVAFDPPALAIPPASTMRVLDAAASRRPARNSAVSRSSSIATAAAEHAARSRAEIAAMFVPWDDVVWSPDLTAPVGGLPGGWIASPCQNVDGPCGWQFSVPEGGTGLFTLPDRCAGDPGTFVNCHRDWSLTSPTISLPP